MMLLLILYVLTQLALEVIIPFSVSTIKIFLWIDFSICLIFLFDWIYFFFKSENKAQYTKLRFFDLISSIPFTQILRPFRILRLIRLVRTLRMIRGLKATFPLFRIILKNPARSALTIYMLLTFVIFTYCAVGLYNFEYGVNENINNIEDVIWMAFTTLTTVGYGDLYPITTGGRIITAILVLNGLGLFGLLTAEIAANLLKYMEKYSS